MNQNNPIEEDPFAVDLDQQAEINRDKSDDKKSKKKSADPRYWKPRIPKKNGTYEGEYQAIIRPMPPKGWIQDKTKPYSVVQQMHYLKDTANNLFLYIKCRKTLGDDEKCTVCDANWAMWRKAKENKDEGVLKITKERIAKETHIGNVMVVADINNPDLNGEIKLWEHTPTLNEKLMEPLRGKKKVEVKDEASSGKPSLKKAGTEQEEKVKKCMPYHPTQGKNRVVIVEPKADNTSMVSYDSSYWEDDLSTIGWFEKGESDLSPENKITPEDNNAIMALLESSYDLSEFTNDVPSVEDMTNRLNEFNQKVIVAGGLAVINPNGGNGTLPPLTERPAQGDAQSFYNAGQTSQAPALNTPLEETTVQAEQPAQSIEEAAVPAGGDEEDDLPF